VASSEASAEGVVELVAEGLDVVSGAEDVDESEADSASSPPEQPVRARLRRAAVQSRTGRLRMEGASSR